MNANATDINVSQTQKVNDAFVFKIEFCFFDHRIRE